MSWADRIAGLYAWAQHQGRPRDVEDLADIDPDFYTQGDWERLAVCSEPP
jgi:hypothetical protein